MFVHLHTHSEYSALDGLSRTSEMVAAVTADGQTAIGVTDHGTCAGHPDFQIACDKAGIKPVFGMEAYFVPNRFELSKGSYWHLVLWATDDEGLRNLWAMSTESFRDGFFDNKAHLDWDTLARLNRGVMCATACLRGPVTKPYVDGDPDLALSNLLRLKEIFGDRLYIEIHANHLPDQITANYWLLEQAAAHNISPIAVVDSHYPAAEDKHLHEVWLAAQVGKEVTDDKGLFEGDEDYHLMTEGEVRRALDYLPEGIVDLCIDNTAAVADRCTARIVLTSHNPVYSRVTPEWPDAVEHDRVRLLEDCLARWHECTRGKSHSHEDYERRFRAEFSLIVEKLFPGYFLMVADLVRWAKEQGILVGPGRGSGSGSLIAYLLGITEIDPVENDILFERFMTKGRTELPDFDIDFPSSKKTQLYGYVAERWGEDHCAAVGTHMRLKSKSVIQSIARALKSQLPEDHWPDVMACSDIIEAAEADTAGLGLSWGDLWDRVGDQLQPYAERYPQIFDLAGTLHGRLRGYGKHPAGVIIDPDRLLTEHLPLRKGSDGNMVAQFDLQVLELLGYVKFDLLNIKNLDVIQRTVDLIYERTGRRVDPYAWREELNDPYLYEQIGQGWTLGVFQLGTHTGIAMCRRMRPQTLHELADLVTLVRPGPSRSGLTDTYLLRRQGGEEVSYPDPRMVDVLSRTQGVMIYQEQLMRLCMVLAGFDDVEADRVRKILGKKKVEEAKAQGAIFIERAVKNGTDQQVAQDLWAQMEEFAKYCLSGDTRLWLAASGPGSDGTVAVEELYRRLHPQLSANSHDRNKGLFALSYFADGRIRPARLLDVIQSGEQELFRVTLAGGRHLDATADHRHLTPEGYRMVKELEAGDLLIIDGGYPTLTHEEQERRGRSSVPDEIVLIESIGSQMTYDVVMEEPHNVVANGIVTHNSFGYAHALSYAVLGIWTAWFKFHYPLEFHCAAISEVAHDEIPEYIEEIRRIGYQVLPPDVNISKRGFGPGDTGLDIRYGLDSIKGVGESALGSLLAGQPYTSWQDFRERSGCNAGVVKTLVHLGVLDSLEPHRRYLERWLDHEAIPGAQKCVHRTPQERSVTWLPTPQRGGLEVVEEVEWTLPCAYDWQQEPDVLGRTGRRQRRKPPPKKCSRACRRFTPAPPPAPGDVQPYTDEEIRQIEQRFFGVYLSSTPFDRIPEKDRETLATAQDVLTGPHQSYPLAAVVQSITTARNRDDMGFLALSTPRGGLRVVMFPRLWEKHRAQLRIGGLVLASVSKNTRGCALEDIIPLD